MRLELAVCGMCCQGCATALTLGLGEVDGVRHVDVDVPGNRLAVLGQADLLKEPALRAKVEEEGYRLTRRKSLLHGRWRGGRAMMSTLAGHQPQRGSRVVQALGGVLTVASCLPMVAMLPGAVATLLATLGITTTSGPFAPVARNLAPVARPLLIAAVLLLVAGSLRCGIGPAVLAAIGGTLLYLSMYVLPQPSSPGMGGMAGMSIPPVGGTAGRAGAVGATNAPLFYLGLAACLGTFVWSAVRRRRRDCRPVSVTAPRIGGTREDPP